MTHRLTGTLIRCLPHACACSLTHVEALLFASGAVRGVGGDVIHKYKKKNANDIANAVVFAYLCSDANYNYNL